MINACLYFSIYDKLGGMALHLLDPFIVNLLYVGLECIALALRSIA